MHIPVLIPAYNPDELLLKLADALEQAGFRDIIIVNDGSRPECEPLFTALDKKPSCHVLHHAINLGKGRAIKTGLNYFYRTFHKAPGIVTADADGQHSARDILRVVTAFLNDPTALVLGARTFDKKTPLRSLVGNLLTKYIFRLLVGEKISDTQSGLRCIPRQAVPLCIGLEGERFDYEMNMLLVTKTNAIPVIETGISTIYLDDNRASSFNPIIDSMKIYFLLLRFFFSSMFASSVDFLVFAGIFYLSDSVLVSIVFARAVAGTINFFVNRKLVFHSSAHVPIAILKYYSLVIVMAALAFLSIEALAGAGMHVIVAKALTETLLFIASFSLQRDYIFGRHAARLQGQAGS